MTTAPPDASPLPLAGEFVAFTGRLSSLSRKDARQVIVRLGGTPIDEVSARTTMLVVGAGGSGGAAAAGAGPAGVGSGAAGAADSLASVEADAEKSRRIRRAESVNAKHPGRIRILTEEQFCALAGVPSPADLRQQWYALRDILAMYPHLREDHLRYLQKWNLVRPALRTDAETYFAFPDLVVIRQTAAELERGGPFRSVLRSLQASRQGQLSFDFSVAAEPAKVIDLARGPAPETSGPSATAALAEEYFREGSALDDGDPRNQEAAGAAYRRALELDPWLVPAVINLANIHYAQDHLIEAEVLYERAIALQPDLFEAHFNLGNVFHDLNRLEEARACYQEAVDLNPRYAEAHFYLAVTLEKVGRPHEARPHWQRYRELAPDGEWVELAREFSEGP